MGYTHYFTVLRRDDLRVEEIGQDIAQLIDNSDVPIVDGMGNPNTSPIIMSDEIRFNGVGANSHETFSFPPPFERNEEW